MKLRTATVAMSMLLTACGSSYETETDIEELDVTMTALGEAGCATQPLTTAGNAHGVTRPFTAPGVGISSPGVGYGTPACPGQFVVEYTNLPATLPPGRVLEVGGRFHGSTLDDLPFAAFPTQASCEAAHLEIAFYIWDTDTVAPSEVLTYEAEGVWQSTGCAGQALAKTFMMRHTGAMHVGAGKHKVRVATRAIDCPDAACGLNSPSVERARAAIRVVSSVE